MIAPEQAGRDAHAMRRAGKSFWLASLLLPRDAAAGAFRLYSFCRAMDDLADDSAAVSSVEALTGIVSDLRSGAANHPAVADFLALAAEYRLSAEPALWLLETLIWDARGLVEIETEEQLLRYCFGAAGTVGMLMCPLLHCQGQRAVDCAVHLGIAMQLTNIARDVLEDANRGRRYLPAEWGCGYSPATIAATGDPAAIAEISHCIDRILRMADAYYASAAQGFVLIPRASRSAIRVAAAVYREIGLRLRAGGLRWKNGRTVVPTRKRLAIALRVWMGGRSVEGCSSLSPAPIAPHRLAALPGVSA